MPPNTLPLLMLLTTLLSAASLASAAPSCVGDTTGPFTPNACVDPEEGSGSATVGPASAAGDDDGAAVSLGTAAGTVTIRVERA